MRITIPKPPKKPEPQDDVPALDMSHRKSVHAGDRAHISMGGMRTTDVFVVARGKDGIEVRDDDGQIYRVQWKHVLGPAGKAKDAQAKQESMTKSIPLIRADALRDIQHLRKAEPVEVDDGDGYVTIQTTSGHPDDVVLRPRNVIGQPPEVNDGERWATAMHEAGHSVVALIAGAGIVGASVQSVERSGSVSGVCYDNAAPGLNSLAVALAGDAAEALGSRFVTLPFESSDYRHAADQLMAEGIHQNGVKAELQRRADDLAADLGRDWRKAIRAVALALYQRGFLDGDAIRRLVSDAQAVGTFTKAMPGDSRHLNVREHIRHSNDFDALAADLNIQAAKREHEQLSTAIHKALADRQPATLVAKLELLRGCAADRIASLGGSHV